MAVAPNALYVIVSNPVDIMTYVFTRVSGIPESQIIGSGTILDTARLRYDLSHRYHIAQKNIHAWSTVSAGIPPFHSVVSGAEPLAAPSANTKI